MTVIFVAGMHRTGSSATARLLNLLGASLGPTADLMKPAADNPLGFWESRRVSDLNERILVSLGGSWDHPTVVDPAWVDSPEAASWRCEVAGALDAVTDHPAPAYAVKDPRLSFTLPIWELALPHSRTVITTRHPYETALSLQVRNDMPLEQGASLWLQYMRSALTVAPHATVVDYADLLESPVEVATKLADILGLQTPIASEVLLRATESVDVKQRHHYVEPDACHVANMREAIDLYQSLSARSVVRGPVPRLPAAKLEQSRSAPADGTGSEVHATDAPFVVYQHHLTTMGLLLTRLTGSPVEADTVSVVEAMLSLHEELITQRIRMTVMSGAQQRAEDLQTQLDVGRAEQEKLSDEVRSGLERTFELRRELDDVRGERDRLEVELSDTRAELEKAREERSVAEEAFNAFKDASAADAANAVRELTEARDALSKLERDLVAARAEQEKLSGDVHAGLDRVVELRGELDDVRGERDGLQVELSDTRAELEQAREQRSVAEEAFNAFKDASAADAATAARELTEARDALAKLECEVQQKEAQRVKVTLTRRATATSQITSAQNNLAARLSVAHSKVREQLAGARGAIDLDSVAVAPPRPVSKFRRLTRLHPLRRTAIFDRGWVAGQLTDRASVDINRYLWDPAYRRVDPHPLFAAAEYLERYPDVAEAGMSPLEHYLQYGWREGRDPHPYFANDWYLQQYPDVLESVLNPLEHYLRYGSREGRKPNPVFDPAAYLDRHEDVRAAGIEPLCHYIAYGQVEGREVPFEGLESTWRSAVPTGNFKSLMNYLLFQEAAQPPADTSKPALQLGEWPPSPLNDYWLPQRVRDFLIDGDLQEALPLYGFLYSVMHVYSEAPDAFPGSEVCKQILDRVRKKSLQRASSARGRPDASIIIPVYNNFLDTLLCLTSVIELECASSFEIIVADDCSNDATAEIIPSIGGVVRHLRQPSNLGFLGNCNAAAETAQGNAIVLLNNDALVLPNWLDALLAPFDRPEPIGFVGSKLISWDGTLQEAGGIFWQDGSAWNFGRGQDPYAPEFNYVKDVDYCSGASIAVPAALWRQLAGFDPLYSPAYCEDADLAFRVRTAGYRTLYNPLSEVVHHEGRSHGRDTRSGIKAYQVTNEKKFRERWEKVLTPGHFPNAQNVLEARDRSRDKTHVLVIDHYVPQWDQDAGSRSMYQYLEIFVDLGFQVTFWPDNLHMDSIYAPALQAMGIEVIYGPRFQDGFENFIEERRHLYDAVFISRPHVADKYLSLLRKHSQARVLYYGHDLHFRRMQASQQAGISVEPQSIEDMKQLELRVCRECDVIFYPGPDEVELIAEEVASDRLVIANPIFVYDDTEIEIARARLPAIPDKQGGRLLFVGGFNHPPNREGIVWFVNEVLPLVVDRVPEVILEVAGTNPPSDVLGLASERVSILGRVSDEELVALYEGCSVAVAPLRYGAGVKGKVIEAMALGVPVATTTFGAQGIEPFHEALFIGDTAGDLAEELVRALTDRVEAARRSERGLDFIKRRYGRSAWSDVLRRLIVENGAA